MPDQNAIIPYDTILPAAGGVAGGLAGKIAGAAREVVCPLYRDFPSFMTGEWASNPIAKYNDSFLNQFCAPVNQLPAPPSSSFSGGQCECVAYDVTINLTGTVVPPSSTFVLRVTGKVLGLDIVSTTNNQGNPAKDIFIKFGSPLCGGVQRQALLGNGAATATGTITQVVRVDGQPDNCGNIAPSYPVTRPPDSALNVNVPVQVSPNFNVSVPVSVFAPINIFAPSLKIGDFNVDFSLGGLTISPTLNVNIPGTKPDGSNPQQPPVGTTPQDRNYDELLSAIFRYVKRLRECQDCDSDYDFLVTGVVAGSANSITVPIGGIPLTAAVTLVTLPSNIKTQPGRGQPDVIFAGWGWWSGNDYLTPRQPIDASTKLFHAPQNPSPAKFHFTVTPGFTAQMLMSYKKRKNPLPPL